MIVLVNEGHEDLGVSFVSQEKPFLGEAILEEAWGERLACGVMACKERIDTRVGGKTLHEDGGELCKIQGTADTGDVVKVGVTEHRMHGVAHLVEENSDF